MAVALPYKGPIRRDEATVGDEIAFFIIIGSGACGVLESSNISG
jgi:hypothetical protein